MDVDTMERKKLPYTVWQFKDDDDDYSSDVGRVVVKHYLVNVLGVHFMVKWLNDKRSSMWKVNKFVIL